ncbi:MAG TPA: hypothetical protein PLD84_00590 [Chitinophagales bacterium]|nr:hypothetical protein [Chitinophagales bacterium]
MIEKRGAGNYSRDFFCVQNYSNIHPAPAFFWLNREKQALKAAIHGSGIGRMIDTGLGA